MELRVFECRVLSNAFSCMGKEVTGGLRKLCNQNIRNS
jgi:hypothetical protein